MVRDGQWCSAMQPSCLSCKGKTRLRWAHFLHLCPIQPTLGACDQFQPHYRAVTISKLCKTGCREREDINDPLDSNMSPTLEHNPWRHWRIHKKPQWPQLVLVLAQLYHIPRASLAPNVVQWHQKHNALLKPWCKTNAAEMLLEGQLSMGTSGGFTCR